MISKYIKDLDLHNLIFVISPYKLQDIFHQIIKEKTDVGVEVLVYVNTDTNLIGTHILNQDDIPKEQLDKLLSFVPIGCEFETTDVLAKHMLGIFDDDRHGNLVIVVAHDIDKPLIGVQMSFKTYEHILNKNNISLLQIPTITESKYFLKCIDDSWNKHMSIRTCDDKVLSFEFMPDNYPIAKFEVYKNNEEYMDAIKDTTWIKDGDSE